jgi:hypothetical protein
MKKKTAVECFALKVMYLKMNPQELFDFIRWLEEAIEMEKQQIKDAYNYGQQIPPFEYAEQYYTETYGNK